MSLHPRKQIRDAIVSSLSGKTGAGAKVYANRVRPWRGGNLPAIGVYLSSETADHEDSSPRHYLREADIVVEIVAAADGQLDDLLDAIALQVEAVILADPTMDATLGDLLEDLVMTGTETQLDKDGDTIIGKAAITFTATYRTLPPEPTLDDFNTGHVDWDMTEADGVIDATDTITVQSEEEA